MATAVKGKRREGIGRVASAAEAGAGVVEVLET